MIRKIAPLTLAVVLAGCGDDNSTTRPQPAVVSSFSVAANDNNVLSAVATLDPSNTDSARIVYWTGSEAKHATPFTSDITSGHMVVLGLRPATQYNMYAEVMGGGATVSSDTATFTTGALDAFLAGARISSSAAGTSGYIMAALLNASDGYIAIFDSTGQLAWYKKFPGQPVAEMKQQANGDYTVILTSSHGGEPVTGSAVELAPDGSTVRTFTAPSGSPYIDDHEFWLLFDNSGAYNGALFLAYNQKHLDLSSSGGPSDSVVSGHQLVRQDASGGQHVVFDAWDHFTTADNVEPIAGQADFDHPNAITFDTDGNYIVSWRDLDAITKINASTGDLMWTLASPLSKLTSDFTFSGDPLNGFSAQHSARIIDNGNLLLFDNGTRHATAASRAVEYKLDARAHTATMVWQYHHAPDLYTQFTGSVQRLQNGNTFIGWPWPPTVEAQEVSATGSTVWEGQIVGAGTQSPYRFTMIGSLYKYEKP